MRVIIAIQCRLSSERMPRKVLADVCGKPMLLRQIERLRKVAAVDGVVVACPEDDAEAIRRAVGVMPVVGPEKDILTRIMNVAQETEADKIVKVGADCPLAPPDLIALGVELSRNHGLVQNTVPRMYPDGFDFEVWDTGMLKNLDAILSGDDREWFTSWALANCESEFIALDHDLSKLRLTVDYPEDLEVIRCLWEDMGDAQWDSDQVIQWCQRNPKVMKLNQKYVTDFGARPK